MGHDQLENAASSTTKLSLLSLPTKPQEPPGMLTPPLRSLASIPFQWEEAPGKPRPCTTESKPKSARTLELPPRLLSEAKGTNLPNSPTTVLDWPYVGRRSLSYTLSFGSSESLGSKMESEKRVLFGSRRWGSFRNNKEFVGDSFNFSSSGGGGGGGGRDSGGTKVKITKISRRRSLLSISHTKTHYLWASIYESFKQAVPWRRRQEKLRKTG